MTQFTIREGNIEEVRAFQLWDENNQGDEILVAEADGVVVGFAQKSGAYVYMVESDVKGAGRALVEFIQAEHGDWVLADNVLPSAVGFWEAMGFWPCAYGGSMEWYPEEDEEEE